MRNRFSAVLGMLAALVGVSLIPAQAVVVPTAVIQSPFRVHATDYGSGQWGGPTTSVIQDSGWASQNLQVGMLGDSIAYRCAAQLRSAFAAKGISFAIRAWAGQNTAGSNNWLESLTFMPDIMFMETGTNDVFVPYAMPAQIVRTKAAIGLGTQLVWADTYVGRPAYLLNDLRNSGQVNSYIHTAIPDDHVVDWVSALTAAHGRGVNAEAVYLDPDGVHPNPSGCAFYAATVINTIAPLL